MINPDMFVMSNGAPTTVAKTLAFSIISWFRGDPDEAAKDEELEQAKADIAKGAETLLAMVWVAENLGLTQSYLRTCGTADPVLNQIIRNVMGKLVVRAFTPGNVGMGGGNTDQVQVVAAFALLSQSIVTDLNRMHEGRNTEQSLRES